METIVFSMTFLAEQGFENRKTNKKSLINYDKKTDLMSLPVPVSKSVKDLVIKVDFYPKAVFFTK